MMLSKAWIRAVGVSAAAVAAGTAQAQTAPQWGTLQTNTAVPASNTAQAATAAQTGSPALGQTEAGVGTSTGTATSPFGNSSGTTSGPLSQVGLQGNNAVGPNGQKVGANGNNPVGPNGKAVGAGYNTVVGPNGQTISTNGVAQGSTGGGGANQYGGRGINWNNGGTAGVSDAPSDAPAKPTGQANAGGDANGSSLGEDLNKANDEWGHPHDGKDSQGNTWKDGKLWDGYDPDGVKYHNGHQASPGVYKGGSEAGDFDNKFGPGSSTSASGQHIAGKVGGGQDGGGGGQTSQGNTGGSAQNATGQTLNVGAVAGQDSPLKKPADTTPINTNKLNNGVTDPTRAGTVNGG